MKRNIVIRIAFLVTITVLFFSCSGNNQFTIKGTITDGNSKMLYFENVTATKVILLDSVKLSKSGSYKFKHQRPEAPDFYRLRINYQFINFTVDSTEVITINSDTLHFAKNYTVEGSIESEHIKTLTLLQLKTSETYNKLQKQYSSQSITADDFNEQIEICIEDYKEEAKNIIFLNPASASAYFAIFQQINSLLIFDPYNKSDSKIYGAVANNWNQRYPDAPRTKHLAQLFTNSLAIIRGEQTQDLDTKTIESKEYFDITLSSYDNKSYRLSEIGKNKIVLVDFIAYGIEGAPLHNQQIAKVYEKYYSNGFLVYQISLDTDEHIWKNSAINLPWICVVDPQSTNSDIVKKYNIRAIPTGFILDRNGDIVKRIEDYTKLENDILTYLK